MANFPLTAEQQQAYNEQKEACLQAAQAYVLAMSNCAEFEFRQIFGFSPEQAFTYKGGKARYKAEYRIDSETLKAEWRMEVLDENGERSGKSRPLSPYDYRALTVVE